MWEHNVSTLVFDLVFILSAICTPGAPDTLLGSTAADVAFVKNILFAVLTLLILVPSIVLPPALIAGGVQELLVTMYIFADDWAASRLSAAASTTALTLARPPALPVGDASAAVAASASASASAVTAPSASSRSPSFATASVDGVESSASSAKVVSELVVARITALMSRVSSLVGVEALTARVASISISYSIAGGLVYVLAAAALVLVPEFVSDSPFSH